MKHMPLKVRMVALCTVFTASCICMTDGVYHSGDTAVFRLGLMLLLMSATGLVCTRATVGPDLLERARQDGYDAGYSDGCSVSREHRITLLPGGRIASGGTAQ